MSDEDVVARRKELVDELRRDNDRLRAHIGELEEELADRDNLYVATYQMHSTFEPAHVLRTVMEILVNFVGAKTFAVYLVDDEPRLLRPVRAEGMELPAAVAIGDGLIGRVAATGEGHVGDVGPAGLDPRICIPLRLGPRVVGAVAIWDFLLQKTRLVEVDLELFDLLAAHAATALEAACLAAAGGASRLAVLFEPAP